MYDIEQINEKTVTLKAKSGYDKLLGDQKDYCVNVNGYDFATLVAIKIVKGGTDQGSEITKIYPTISADGVNNKDTLTGNTITTKFNGAIQNQVYQYYITKADAPFLGSEQSPINANASQWQSPTLAPGEYKVYVRIYDQISKIESSYSIPFEFKVPIE